MLSAFSRGVYVFVLSLFERRCVITVTSGSVYVSACFWIENEDHDACWLLLCVAGLVLSHKSRAWDSCCVYCRHCIAHQHGSPVFAPS